MKAQRLSRVCLVLRAPLSAALVLMALVFPASGSGTAAADTAQLPKSFFGSFKDVARYTQSSDTNGSVTTSAHHRTLTATGLEFRQSPGTPSEYLLIPTRGAKAQISNADSWTSKGNGSEGCGVTVSETVDSSKPLSGSIQISGTSATVFLHVPVKLHFSNYTGQCGGAQASTSDSSDGIYGIGGYDAGEPGTITMKRTITGPMGPGFTGSQTHTTTGNLVSCSDQVVIEAARRHANRLVHKARLDLGLEFITFRHRAQTVVRRFRSESSSDHSQRDLRLTHLKAVADKKLRELLDHAENQLEHQQRIYVERCKCGGENAVRDIYDDAHDEVFMFHRDLEGRVEEMTQRGIECGPCILN
jgi:hypothetical protein